MDKMTVTFFQVGLTFPWLRGWGCLYIHMYPYIYIYIPWSVVSSPTSLVSPPAWRLRTGTLVPIGNSILGIFVRGIHGQDSCEALLLLRLNFFRSQGCGKNRWEKIGPSWWLNQPPWKICSSKWESSPSRGENKIWMVCWCVYIWVFPKIVVYTPKRTVYKWKTLLIHGWFGGKTPIFGNTQVFLLHVVISMWLWNYMFNFWV